MLIALGSDEELPVVGAIEQRLTRSGHVVERFATGAAWPEVGREVALAVADGRCELGVVCCYTGTGVTMAANKVSGIRAALCTDAATASGARRWNDANVLGLSLRLASDTLAGEIVDAFLAGEADPGEAPVIARLDEH